MDDHNWEWFSDPHAEDALLAEPTTLIELNHFADPEAGEGVHSASDADGADLNGAGLNGAGLNGAGLDGAGLDGAGREGTPGPTGTNGLPSWPAAYGDDESAPTKVGTLRAILLGDQPNDHATRLDALEQRLDALATRLEQTPRAPVPESREVEQTRLAALERRLEDLAAEHQRRQETLDTLAMRIDEAQAATRGNDVTLGSLDALQRQIDELRLDQAHATAAVTEQLRQLDGRCTLRQQRNRIAQRMELLHLRRRVYAPDLAPHPRPQAVAEVGVSELDAAFAPDSVPLWPAVPGESAPPSASAQPDMPAVMLDGAAGHPDAAVAWRAVRHSTRALLHAFGMLLAALMHLLVKGLRGAGRHIGGLLHGRQGE